MATKLALFVSTHPRGVESADVRAAFMRISRARWGDHMPLEPLRISRGTLTVRCPSPLWRTEMLFNAEDLQGSLLEELPGTSLTRISAVLV